LALIAVGLPLWQPLLLAAVLSTALRNLHAWLTARLHGRRGIAAWICVLGVVVLVLVPVAAISWLGIAQAGAAVEFVKDAVRTHKLAHLADKLPQPAGQWESQGLEKLPDNLAEFSRGVLTPEKGVATAAVLGGALSWGAQIFVRSFLMLIALWFLLVEGESLVTWLVAAAPLHEGQAARLIGEFAVTSRIVLGSMLISAVSQGAAATLGFVLAGVPQPVFFGLLTFFASFVPAVGTGAVGLPIAAILALAGHPVSALFLVAWTLLVVGLIDNLFKPMLIRGRVPIHGALIFFALLGGLALLGPTGLIVGPLALTFFVTMVHMGQAQGTRVELTPEEPRAAH
jgi:predicted PurR-regulated permease PerM